MISKGYKKNFDAMGQAFRNGHVALMECTDKATGKPVIVVCMVNHDGEEIAMVPVAKLFDGNPYEELEPPC